MTTPLEQLLARFPPPAKPRFTPVKWSKLEVALGFCYPTSFKEFIDVYGGCVWFDNLSPMYSQARTKKEVDKFLQVVEQKCNQDRGNFYDEKFKPISPAFYPERGGLFPFLIDYGGNEYFWDTKSADPDLWPIVQSHAGWMKLYPPMSIPELILKWLGRDPQMLKMWGDVSKWPVERIRITEK